MVYVVINEKLKEVINSLNVLKNGPKLILIKYEDKEIVEYN